MIIQIDRSEHNYIYIYQYIYDIYIYISISVAILAQAIFALKPFCLSGHFVSQAWSRGRGLRSSVRWWRTCNAASQRTGSRCRTCNAASHRTGSRCLISVSRTSSSRRRSSSSRRRSTGSRGSCSVSGPGSRWLPTSCKRFGI